MHPLRIFILRTAACALLLLTAAARLQAIPARKVKPEPPAPWPAPNSKPGTPSPGAPLTQRLYGIGIGFEKSGNLSGMPISIVLAGSPAARAGLGIGCIIVEINGETTLTRTGDDCVRLVRESPDTVRLKYLDPTFRERTLTLQKEWLTLPE